MTVGKFIEWVIAGALAVLLIMVLVALVGIVAIELAKAMS